MPVSEGSVAPSSPAVAMSAVDPFVYDVDSWWILQFDDVIKHPGGKCRGCQCDIHARTRHRSTGSRDDEPDATAVRSATKARANSVPRKGSYSTCKTPIQAAGGQAGAVDEEMFARSFNDVTPVQLFSARELEEQLNIIRDTISDPAKDWSKRVESLRKLRALLLAGATQFDELHAHIRLLEPALQTSVRDLRSQVVREACISIAFLSEQLGQRLDHLAEFLLPSIIHLIQNSAKIMSTAGVVTVRYILRYVHAPRLIPIIATNMSSKSREIRRACCEFLEQLLSTWQTHSLERHIALLQDAVRKGVADADNDARVLARKAYWSFRSHFPDQADVLLNSLETTYKRALNGEALSNSSSTNSLNTQGVSSRYGTVTPRLPRQTSSATDSYNVGRRGSPVGSVSLRSNSAIDLQAAQRAKARAQYAALARLKVGSGASLPRPRRSPDAGNHDTPGNNVMSPERQGRTRGRVTGVSQSQPSSRSGSPSSRLAYHTPTRDLVDSPRVRRLSSSSGIPRSTGASREASPTRHSPFGSKLRGGTAGRPPQGSPVRPVMAARILQQSREAEHALADALYDESTPLSAGQRKNSAATYRNFDDHSDESETSSVCSERSFDSFRRPSDSYSWSGSQQRLYRELLEPTIKDIVDIISNCASTHWTDRKDGLMGLQAYFQQGNMLTGSELKKVTEIFTKMFMDTHTKVYSLFLDTLNELVVTHKADLEDWLYVLLTRLLNKLGGDLLNSITTKLNKSLATVRESFPPELVCASLLRYIVDPTQTPNARSKCAALVFLSQLTASLDPGAISSSRDTTSAAVSRIVTWTTDPKSAELRRNAADAVRALYDLNTPQVVLICAALPKDVQETANALMRTHLTRGQNGSTPSSPSTPAHHHQAASGGAAPRSPHRHAPHHHAPHHDDNNFSVEEVYRSLRRTTAEIQNYSYEAAPGGRLGDRDTTSQDSGISQMSAGYGERMDVLQEHMEDLSLNHSGRSSSLSSPTHRHREGSLLVSDDYTITSEGFYHPNGTTPQELNELLRKCGRTLEAVNEGETTAAEKVVALMLMNTLVQMAPTPLLVENIRMLLRVLLGLLENPVAKVRQQLWTVMTELFRKPGLGNCFQGFAELLLLKVLEYHNDKDKEVCRLAENCAAAMSAVLHPDIVVRVVKPVIKTGAYPLNQGAIKILTRLIEQRPVDALEVHLGDLMAGLIEAYDHRESPVRKSAVFCIVALHTFLGEEKMSPYLKNLSSSKMKLLALYIRRSEQGASAPTSPKNAPL